MTIKIKVKGSGQECPLHKNPRSLDCAGRFASLSGLLRSG
jgi:hypothetical protein